MATATEIAQRYVAAFPAFAVEMLELTTAAPR
jgi:hypothetical protein